MSFASLTRTLPLALGLVTALVADDARAADWNIQVQKRSATSARVTFDAEPAPMAGGVWLSSSDGRRQATADWQQKAQELSGSLAERLLALL